MAERRISHVASRIKRVGVDEDFNTRFTPCSARYPPALGVFLCSTIAWGLVLSAIVPAATAAAAALPSATLDTGGCVTNATGGSQSCQQTGAVAHPRWTLSLSEGVLTVPLPASAWLILGGVMGLVEVRRRQRR